MSNKLKIPLAWNVHRQEVRPEKAVRGGVYVCPSCRVELLLKTGSAKRPHFAHRTDPAYCSFLHENESEEHLRAKWAILRAIEEGRPVRLLRNCASCGSVVRQPLPATVKKAVLEYPLPSGHRADVALMGEKERLLAVLEVYVTHEVDEEKETALQGLRWGEFRAADLLASDEWPIKRDRFKPVRCEQCTLIARYAASLPFTGPLRQQVACPKSDDALVYAVEECAPCDYFLEARRNGIHCFGEAARHAKS